MSIWWDLTLSQSFGNQKLSTQKDDWRKSCLFFSNVKSGLSAGLSSVTILYGCQCDYTLDFFSPLEKFRNVLLSLAKHACVPWPITQAPDQITVDIQTKVSDRFILFRYDVFRLAKLKFFLLKTIKIIIFIICLVHFYLSFSHLVLFRVFFLFVFLLNFHVHLDFGLFFSSLVLVVYRICIAVLVFDHIFIVFANFEIKNQKKTTS